MITFMCFLWALVFAGCLIKWFVFAPTEFDGLDYRERDRRRRQAQIERFRQATPPPEPVPVAAVSEDVSEDDVWSEL